MKAVLLRLLDGGKVPPRFVCPVCAAGFPDRWLLDRHFARSLPCQTNRLATRRADDRDDG